MRACICFAALTLHCGAAGAASFAVSPDGRWRVEGDGTAVIVRDGEGRPIKSLAARSLGGGDGSTVRAVAHLPQRRSFAITFDSLAELWELSVDPAAPPLHEGLVHDYRMGEAIAAPGFLGVRRTALPAPAEALAVDEGNNAQLLVQVTASGVEAWLLVNLDVRRPIARFSRAAAPQPASPRQR